jgi:hypothetical protein
VNIENDVLGAKRVGYGENDPSQNNGQCFPLKLT